MAAMREGFDLNERTAVVSALLAGEAGGSILLMAAAPPRVALAGYDSATEALLPHLLAVAGIWAIVFVIAWSFFPAVWRRRQELSTKLRLLRWVFALGLGLDAAVTSAFFYVPMLRGSFQQLQMGGRLGFALALLLRAAGESLFFWMAVWIQVGIAKRHVPAVTPPPRFGRE